MSKKENQIVVIPHHADISMREDVPNKIDDLSVKIIDVKKEHIKKEHVKNEKPHKMFSEEPQSFAKMKGIPTYLFINPSTKKIACALVLQDGDLITGKVRGAIAKVLLECGYNAEQGTSIEASALFEQKIIADQKELF